MSFKQDLTLRTMSERFQRMLSNYLHRVDPIKSKKDSPFLQTSLLLDLVVLSKVTKSTSCCFHVMIGFFVDTKLYHHRFGNVYIIDHLDAMVHMGVIPAT
jgi:hypothetical protein